MSIPYCPPAPVISQDHWIPLASLDEMASKDYDIIIVGSGAGGGAVLWRLCEQWMSTGKRIGVVERGDLLLPTHYSNLPTGESVISPVNIYNNPRIGIRLGETLPQFPGIRLVHALGGRTLFWGAICPRMPDFELAEWPVGIQEMHRYYSIAERVMNVTTSYSESSTFTQIFLDRLRANGYPEATDQPIAGDIKPTQYGEIHSNVFFSSINFFARALRLHPFDLAVKARAIQVLTDRGKTLGVRVMTPDKRFYDLRAKNVVLAASALETPRILLCSGIQGGAIGHYLTNHSIVRANGVVSSKGFPEILGVVSILMPQTKNRPFQLQILGPGDYFAYQSREKPRNNEWNIDHLGSLGRVESRYENRVTLDPVKRDPYGIPEIQVHFNYSQKDTAVIYETRETIRKVASILKMELKDICLFLPGADNHESGTCRMGFDPNTSVTNPFGQVHGVSGLFVTDNSVLPSMGAANPTLTTVALALRTADYISSLQNE